MSERAPPSGLQGERPESTLPDRHALRHEWRIALAALLVSAVVLTIGVWPRASSGSVRFRVGIVPSDIDTLECRGPATKLEGMECGEVGSTAATRPGWLRPYVTLGGELVLLSNVFEQPEVLAWVKQSRRARRNEPAVLRCKGVAHAHLPSVEVRFRPEDAFRRNAHVPVVRVSHCSVEDR